MHSERALKLRACVASALRFSGPLLAHAPLGAMWARSIRVRPLDLLFHFRNSRSVRTSYNPDQYELGGAERVRQRQELVHLFYRLGIKETEIIQRLQDDGYLPVTWEYRKKQLLVNRDVRRARKNDLDRYHRLIANGDQALVSYIGKLEVLFERAYGDGNWHLCRDLSKDLARAHGVPTEEPIRIEGDILSQMQLAFQVGMRRIAEQKQPPRLESRSDELQTEVHAVASPSGEQR